MNETEALRWLEHFVQDKKDVIARFDLRYGTWRVMLLPMVDTPLEHALECAFRSDRRARLVDALYDLRTKCEPEWKS